MSDNKRTPVTKKFHYELLDDILYKKEGYKLVSNEVTDRGRWSVYYNFVFLEEATGLFYSGNYTSPATEMQDEERWDKDSEDMVTCEQVAPVIVPTTAYHVVYQDEVQA